MSHTNWIPIEFLNEIPKTDLHVHLDGSIRLSTIIELANSSSTPLPSSSIEELRTTIFKSSYNSLEEYLEGFKYTTACMKSVENLERISYEFAIDNYKEGVRYFEVRFAPQLIANVDNSHTMSVRNVIRIVNNGLKKAKIEYNSNITNLLEPTYDYGIIVCAMRMFPEGSSYYDTLMTIHEDLDDHRLYSLASETLVKTAIKCRDIDNIPVVALDIAGAENGYPNKEHKIAFDIANENFLCKTVHAGEGYGPESISQAVQDLNCFRIGHGFHLFSSDLINDTKIIDKDKYIRSLVKFICDRRICLEVCLTSNLGTMPNLKLEDHALKNMIKHGVSICINTDNRLISDTTTIKELKSAIDTFDLSPKQIRDIVITGFKRSFFHGEYLEKRRYIRKAMDYYDSLCEKYNIQELYEAHKFKNNVGSELDTSI